MTPSEIAAALIEAAKREGAGAADAMVVAETNVAVGVREGALEEAESAEGVDYGLRVLIGGRQASVSASDPSLAVIEELAARAVAMAREAPEDPWAGLAPEDRLADVSAAPDLEIFDPADPPSPAALKAMALRAEAAALGVEGVSQVESAAAQWSRLETAFATTGGFAGAYERSGHAISASAVAGTGLGMETDYDVSAQTWAEDLAAPEDVGRTAGERAVERLGARKAKTGAWPVIFDRRVAGSLVGHVIGAINGLSVARGASWLKDMMGEQVLPDGVSLIDDPHRKRGAGSRPFDAEGVAMSRRALIEDGVLRGWLLDSATARQLGLTAPGGARRGVGSPPSPGASNLTLTKGDRSRDDLIRDMGEGLIVTSLIGSSVSATTGAYSRGASGFWVENGEIAYPVNELTIAGSLPDFMKRLIPADDTDMTKSRRVPSVLVEGLTVASG